ncbi:MAG: AraC family transcriptional regulator [Halomonadaceae bacterium]|nr:MAG: AraC family transcriptional regulator [Halomonadaceae bacterium]
MNTSVNHSGLGLPAIYLHLVQQVLNARGMDSRRLLVESGLDPDSLLQEESRIPLSTAAVFMHRAIIESREPGLGFLLAEELRLPLHGPLGRAVMSSENLREVLDMMTRFIALRIPLLQVNTYREGRYSVIEFSGDGPTALTDFVLDAVTVGCVYMGKQIINARTHEQFIERKGAEPACYSRFKDQLPVSIRYERRRNALLFPVEWLDYPVRFSDSEVAQVSRAQCEQSLQQLTQDQGLRPRVRRIVATSHPFPPRLGQVAQSLFMSERTLKRHLQGEGATYQEVVDDVRLERAEKLLTTTRLSLGQISDALGYADAANFTRAFKRWTGISPSAYRRESAMRNIPTAAPVEMALASHDI